MKISQVQNDNREKNWREKIENFEKFRKFSVGEKYEITTSLALCMFENWKCTNQRTSIQT